MRAARTPGGCIVTADQYSLREQYKNLQSQWRQLAIKRERQYLPYLAPRAPVDFVLVGKMTSISEKDAATTPPANFRKPVPPSDIICPFHGDLILNYGAHRHLCRPGERYYLTDLGKCAIPPKYAKGKILQQEFTVWYPMLLEEMKLVAKPEATVVPPAALQDLF